ncbi:MAG TPA: DUF748 domain-containing protein [Candidatus Bathyarchaeia archaeon]|nr:DUF748 domain-containing protein [Candidatus Bathyarchaeia archaeon]
MRTYQGRLAEFLDVVTRSRRWVVAGVAGGLALLIALEMAFFVDAPLRRYTEAKANRALKGYTAHIGRLDFHPLGFSLDLFDVVVIQNAHPDPAVARIPRLSASVHWRALLSGRVVADILLDRPTVYLNLTQARQELTDPTPVKERGWQEALEAIYPLKVNHFRVENGSVTYVDRGPFKPLRLRHLDIDATNIRNVKSEDRVYPSEFRVESVVFESGRMSARGRADFLAEPHATFLADFTLEDLELDYFKPITNRYNVTVNKGLLSAEGRVESARDGRSVEISRATIAGMRVDYIHTTRTAGVERRQRGQAVQAVARASDNLDLRYRIAELRISQSRFGFVNEAAKPPYHVFVSDTDAVFTNLTNQAAEGPGRARLQGKFMGTGTAVVDATYRAEKAGPGFDLAIRIDDVELPSMNDLFRAYGKFDVAAGRFAFYSELKAQEGAITGYVKPLFRDIVVYDPVQDRDKTVFQKMYERVVGAMGKALRNRSREEVATRAEVSGRLDDPNVGTMEVVVKLIQNAFFKAILPGFDQERLRVGRRSAGAEN